MRRRHDAALLPFATKSQRRTVGRFGVLHLAPHWRTRSGGCHWMAPRLPRLTVSTNRTIDWLTGNFLRLGCHLRSLEIGQGRARTSHLPRPGNVPPGTGSSVASHGRRPSRDFHSKPRKNTSCLPINAENATLTARFAHPIIGTLDAFNDCDWRVRVRFDEDKEQPFFGLQNRRGLEDSKYEALSEGQSVKGFIEANGGSKGPRAERVEV